MRHPEQVGEDGGRFQGAGGVDEHIGPLGQQADEVDSVRLSEEVEIGVVEFVGVQAGFAGDGAETGVGVLEVGACVAFERGHGVQVEVVSVDTITHVRKTLLYLGSGGHTAFHSCPAP